MQLPDLVHNNNSVYSNSVYFRSAESNQIFLVPMAMPIIHNTVFLLVPSLCPQALLRCSSNKMLRIINLQTKQYMTTELTLKILSHN